METATRPQNSNSRREQLREIKLSKKTRLVIEKDERKGGGSVLTLNGYYDGNTVQTLEKIQAKKNQKVIITILDEFMEDSPQKVRTTESARGSLAKYANPSLWDKEGSQGR